jgi:uncharacterized protein with HEPN domain
MSRLVLDRLKDILRAAQLAVLHAGGLDASALASEHKSRDAALLQIAVIGEAVSHLPGEIQALAPEIPWHQIKGMRNHIIHAYWQVDLVTVAQTIVRRLDPLTAAANRLVTIIEGIER